MNQYVAIGLFAAFIAWSGFMYYEGGSKESAVCGKADAQHDLAQADITVAAAKGVIATVAKQQTITQGVDHDYQLKKDDIDSQYVDSFIGVQPEGAHSSHSMPAIAGATGRPYGTTSRPFRTKVFKLNEQECDDNTEQLYGLQDWERQQTH